MTPEERQALKLAVDAATRARVRYIRDRCPNGHRSGLTGYRKGCRCQVCSEAHATSRARSVARSRGAS